MKINMKYWADEVGGRKERMEIELKPFGYRMVPITQWKTLIAKETVEVRKGKPCIIEIKPFSIPGDTMVGPLHIMRHALGTVLDVVECGIPQRVEDEKCINKVLFLPVEDGVIEKGDIVGVLKVFFIKTGLLSRILNLKPARVELREEIIEANITWRDNGNIYRKRMRTEVFGYTRTNVGVWEVLVSEEDLTFKAGDILRVNIREVNLPPNTVVVPLSVTRNPYGVVVDVVQLGRPARVEESKKIQQAIFVAIEDGEIRRGDLIGVANVYYVGVKKLEPIMLEKQKQKFTMVYRKNGEIIREDVEIKPYGYRRSPIARWEVVVAAEDREVVAGKPVRVKIKEIDIPSNTIVYPLQIMRHSDGAILDLICDCRPWRVEEGGSVREAVFMPVFDGQISKGDLLGVVNLYRIEVSPIEKIREIYNKFVKMSEEELMKYVEGLQ
ncbi:MULTISPECIES: DUF22 domain-containing protein [unclassified Archaeoglobus]|jgi:hypothetical protein|uniref:DUF22 domain-containing protein n=1 Tax=unclassified Archaeoglobus TaxID=2643606 RepID=UPI0025C5AF0E|nr:MULTISPECIES: DUF22 domain-containing protein [unclassified Archaeoglobus]